MEKHNWTEVRDALESLLEYTEKNESGAVNFIDAINAVLADLPEDGEF